MTAKFAARPLSSFSPAELGRAAVGFLLLGAIGAGAWWALGSHRVALPASPLDQVRFVSTIESFRQVYKTAANDLVAAKARSDRGVALCKVASKFDANGWTGRVADLTTNGDGLGVIEIAIGDDVSVRTWNNSLSDISAKTMFPIGSELFKIASGLKVGDAVKFSGMFMPGARDCLGEVSMTDSGSMNTPSYVLRFSALSKI
jgi:hypothetical protein